MEQEENGIAWIPLTCSPKPPRSLICGNLNSECRSQKCQSAAPDIICLPSENILKYALLIADVIDLNKIYYVFYPKVETSMKHHYSLELCFSLKINLSSLSMGV